MAMRCASTLFSLVAIIELACASLNETVVFSETSAQSRTEDSSRYIFVAILIVFVLGIGGLVAKGMRWGSEGKLHPTAEQTVPMANTFGPSSVGVSIAPPVSAPPRPVVLRLPRNTRGSDPNGTFAISDAEGHRISTIYDERDSMAIEYDGAADYSLHPDYVEPTEPSATGNQEEGWSKALRSHGHATDEQFGEVVSELQAHHALASESTERGPLEVKHFSSRATDVPSEIVGHEGYGTEV